MKLLFMHPGSLGKGFILSFGMICIKSPVKLCFVLSLLLIGKGAFAQLKTIEVVPESFGQSCATNLIYFEEDGNVLLPEQALFQLEHTGGQVFKDRIGVLDFNASRWWFGFSFINATQHRVLLLETARPVTNKVHLYVFRNHEVIQHEVNGDDYSFSRKSFPHRKCIFPVEAATGDTLKILLMAESDGEVITLPVKFYSMQAFAEYDYKNQWFLGFYYGFLFVVGIIYFIFYIMLRDRSFLYYVGYVFAQFLLQFSLDGYAFQYLFPRNPWLASHSVIFSAALAVFFAGIYPQTYLQLRKRSKALNRVYRIFLILIVITSVIAALPGVWLQISYPLINGLSFVGLLLVLASIYWLKHRKFKVNLYFALAFTVLIAGAIIFILGNFNVLGDPEQSLLIFKVASLIEIVLLSVTMASKYRELQKEKEQAQQQVLEQLQQKNKLMDEINVRLEQQVKERTVEIERQKEELHRKNDEIMDSIRYAGRIQKAILPPDEVVKSVIPESFVLFMPRDIVSGDFYFVAPVTTTDTQRRRLDLFAAVDCTGHGVPGAFMSIVGNNYLTEGLTHPDVNSTGEALDFLNAGVLKTLRQQSDSQERVRDGMDIAFCAIDRQAMMLYYSGAKNPVYLIRRGELQEWKGDKMPIGEFFSQQQQHFTTHSIPLETGDMIYVFTDGYADQFGGPDTPETLQNGGKKFTYKRFKNLLVEISTLPPDEQKQRLHHQFLKWKGRLEQVDDVCVIGVRL